MIRMLKQLSVTMELSDFSFGGSGLDLLSSDYPEPPLPVLSLELGFSLTEADQGKASTDMYVIMGLLQEDPSVRTSQRHMLEKG